MSMCFAYQAHFCWHKRLETKHEQKVFCHQIILICWNFCNYVLRVRNLCNFTISNLQSYHCEWAVLNLAPPSNAIEQRPSHTQLTTQLPSHKDPGIVAVAPHEPNGGVKCGLEKQASQHSAKMWKRYTNFSDTNFSDTNRAKFGRQKKCWWILVVILKKKATKKTPASMPL